MDVVSWIWLVVTIASLVDVFRHSSADWAYADRSRAFWVVFLFFFGLLFFVPYLVLVRPRFPVDDSVPEGFGHDG